MGRIRQLLREWLDGDSIHELSEPPGTVYVVVCQHEHHSKIAGVFATEGEAWQYLVAEASMQGEIMMRGTGGTCDIGRDWYTIQAYEVQ